MTFKNSKDKTPNLETKYVAKILISPLDRRKYLITINKIQKLAVSGVTN